MTSKLTGALALLLLTALFFSVQVASGGTEQAAAGDTVLYYYPQYASAGATLREGRLPLWNPYQLCGHPRIGTLSGGFLYPFHLAYAFLPTGTAMALSSLFHLALVALSTALLARRLGCSRWPALLAGALFCMQGKLPAQTSVPNLLEAAAWLSPGAVAVTLLAEGRRAGGVALLAASLAASLLAGFPQYTVYACYTWAALLALLLYARKRPAREWLAPALCFALSIGAGALVAGPQLAASFELSGLSTRPLEAARLPALFPLGWPTESAADAFRLLFSSDDTRLPFPFGLAGLALLPAALLHRERRLALGLVALLLVVLGMALGPVTPLFDLYLLLPGTAAFRVPTLRLLLVVGFLFALLAGLGLDELLRRLRRRSGPGRAEALGAIALAVVALEALLDDAPRPELPYSGRGYEAIYEVDQPLFPLLSGAEHRVLFWNPGVRPPLPPKLGSVFRLQVFDDYEPMSLRRQALYHGYLAHGRIEDGDEVPFFGRLDFPRGLADAESMASRRRLLDLAAVRFLAGTSEQRRDPILRTFAEQSGLVRLAADPRERETAPVLYENPHAFARSYVTYRAVSAPPPEELLPRIADPGFDPWTSSYVEGPEIGVDRADLPRGHPAAIVRSSETEVEIQADLAAEGLVVLSDSFYPGWRATLDGEPAEILATNLLFRGVVAPPGPHRIVYRYEPGWLPATFLASAAALAAVASLALGAVLRGRARVAR